MQPKQIYQLHKDRIYRLVCRLCPAKDSVDDIVQEVFVKAFHSLDSLRNRDYLGTWLYRIAINTTRTFLTRESHYQTSLQKTPLATERPDVQPENRFHLLRALERLPQKYKEVLILHDLEGMTHEEIGEILGIVKGTSKSQLHKARKKMRELLLED